ncbi:MAG: HAD family phosphatase [Granulicella sp.]
MSAVKTIFWDIGGVLLSNGWGRQQRWPVLESLHVDREDFESRYIAANYLWERGLCTHYDYFAKTIFHADQPSRDFTFEELWSLACAQSKVLHPESFDILGRLKDTQKYTLATLNNESRELNEYRLDAFRLRPYFDFFICSGYVHEMKPHPDIYHAAIEISGCAPAQTLFIDDTQANCEAAASLGMDAILFQSPTQLTGELTQRGILSA